MDKKELEKKVDEILERGVLVEFLPTKKEFREKLLSGENLRFYIGADPTAKALHLGHAQNLMILEDFRKLGHEVIFLIGDFTGMIGDPTDKGAARVRQTREGVEENFKNWLEQTKNILSFDDKDNPVKVKYNSEW
ncbi:MAG: tyrosyl-tRNA synthetase, partial [Parcubacteria group bacterium Athens0714_25]